MGREALSCRGEGGVGGEACAGGGEGGGVGGGVGYVVGGGGGNRWRGWRCVGEEGGLACCR